MKDLPANAVFLIDAPIYFFRYYFSLPDNWHADNGFSTNGVYGYSLFLLQLLQRMRPELIAAAFDESLGSGFRHKLYSQYKSSRALPDEAISYQLDGCKKISRLLGIATFASNTYEADDLIATIAKRLRRTRRPVTIITRDKDLGQLLKNEDDHIWDFANEMVYNKLTFAQKVGVKPHQLVDYLTLVGDPIDDIPGVPGIGSKTAQLLLQRYDSLLEIYSSLAQLPQLPLRGAKSLADKLIAHQEQITMVKKLVALVETVPLEVTANELRWQKPELKPIIKFYRKMGFGPNAEKRLVSLLGD